MGAVDVAFLWMRYIHFALVPLLVFAIHKDLRKKSKDLLCCCLRPNSVESASPRPISVYIRKRRQELRKQRMINKNLTNYR